MSTPRPRILFVDDDDQVLEGLAGALWRARRVWDMTFAHGGEAALTALAAGPFDAVVSDMRMPVVDGEAVLRAARQQWPSTLRIILSGQTDRATTTRATAIAHQFLSKPCPPDDLRACLERMLRLSATMDPRMREVVCGAGPLPITAEARARLDALFAAPIVHPEEILRSIDEDVGLMAKLMHVASAGFFAKRQPVTAVAQAVDILGIDAVREFVGSSEAPPHTRETRRINADALAAGRRLVELSHDAQAILAGIWYGVGQLALLDRFGDDYAQLLAAADDDPGVPLPDRERARYGLRHEEVGAHIVELWGLADAA